MIWFRLLLCIAGLYVITCLGRFHSVRHFNEIYAVVFSEFLIVGLPLAVIRSAQQTQWKRRDLFELTSCVALVTGVIRILNVDGEIWVPAVAFAFGAAPMAWCWIATVSNVTMTRIGVTLVVLFLTVVFCWATNTFPSHEVPILVLLYSGALVVGFAGVR